MKRLLSLTVLVLLLVAPLAAAQAEPPQQSGYVSDYAEIIDAKTETALALLLETMEEQYGNKVVILTVESTAPLGVDDYSAEVFRRWSLGPDDLLFLVALRDGKVRLEAGRRLNRALTDEKLQEIMAREIMPSFEQGNFSQGVLRGTVALTSAIKEIKHKEAKGEGFLIWTVIGLAVIAAVALFFVLKS
ncbi:MAG: TPM domain-containing protein [Candidatus Bipolaricaulia bacterium]